MFVWCGLDWLISGFCAVEVAMWGAGWGEWECEWECGRGEGTWGLVLCCEIFLTWCSDAIFWRGLFVAVYSCYIILGILFSRYNFCRILVPCLCSGVRGAGARNFAIGEAGSHKIERIEGRNPWWGCFRWVGWMYWRWNGVFGGDTLSTDVMCTGDDDGFGWLWVVESLWFILSFGRMRSCFCYLLVGFVRKTRSWRDLSIICLGYSTVILNRTSFW